MEAELNPLLNLDAYKELLEQLKEFQSLKTENETLRLQVAEEKIKTFNLSDNLNKLQGTIRLFCRNCKNHTHHIVLDEKTIPQQMDDEGFPKTYMVYGQLQCSGCLTILFKEHESDLDDNVIGKPKFRPDIKKWFLYPKETIVKNLQDVKLNKIYQDAIECYNGGMEIPCSVSLRTLIEGIGVSLKIKDELVAEGISEYNVGIEKMVKRMVEKGIITKNISEILSDLRFLGNEATHKLIQHPKEELALAILIVENIIENIYVIPEISKELNTISDSRRKATTIQ